MNDIIQKHRKELEETFRKERVVLAYLFGSQARGTAGPLSDVDVAVLFSDDVPKEKQFDKRLKIGSAITLLLHKDTDVIGLNAAPPLLKHRAVLHGDPIFVKDKSVQRSFELRVLQEYEDFSYHLKNSHELIKRRIKQRALGVPHISSLTSKYLKRYVPG